MIDLESLFHPRKEYIDTKELDRLASSTLAQSVLYTGLLPLRRWSGAEYEGIDISGLGGKEGQPSQRLSPTGKEPVVMNAAEAQTARDAREI